MSRFQSLLQSEVSLIGIDRRNQSEIPLLFPFRSSFHTNSLALGEALESVLVGHLIPM